MKTINKSTLVSAAFLLFGTFSLKAQSICMVTADFDTAENYIVVWEKPLDISGIDSVLVYRKSEGEVDFSRIGSISMQNDFSFFVDQNANTMTNTWYRISFLDTDGNEGTPSPWHRPVVMDYLDGLLVWTEYEKENQLDETWITGYACMRDETGLGLFGTMGYWETAAGNTQTQWLDTEAGSSTDYTYQMIVDLPSCDITRANINTSRSNIKRQSPNSAANINELEQMITFSISPNPVSETLSVVFDKNMIESEFKLTSSNGKVVANGKVESENYTLDVNHLSKGSYFFHVSFQGKNYSRMFIKN